MTSTVTSNDSCSHDKFDDASVKISEYLQLILDRLETHLETWNCNVESNSEQSVKLLELSLYSQKLFEMIEMDNIPLNTQLVYIWNGLNLILDPLWEINERIISLFNDLDSLYTELKLLSKPEKNDSAIEVEIIKVQVRSSLNL